jgi:hypothetical protein
MNNCELVPQSGQYRVLIAGKEIGKIQPGAQLNHYGIVLEIQGTAITYSVVCPQSNIAPFTVIRDLLDGFERQNVKYRVITQGLFEAVVAGAMVILKCGGIAICGLWLHEVEGVRMTLRDQPNISYWVSILHTKITSDLQLSIILQDAINLRYVFARLANKSNKS